MQMIDIRQQLKDPSLFKEEAFINGSWVTAASGEKFTVNNPATNEMTANVANLERVFRSLVGQ